MMHGANVRAMSTSTQMMLISNLAIGVLSDADIYLFVIYFQRMLIKILKYQVASDGVPTIEFLLLYNCGIFVGLKPL